VERFRKVVVPRVEPEQISGKLKKEQKMCISREWSYQYVLEDQRASGDLYRHLRCQKKRCKRYGKYDHRGKLPNCRSIEGRPKVVDRRMRLGSWEADIFLCKNHNPVMISLTERKSRFTLLGKIPQRTAQAVRKQTVRLLWPIADKVHTLTSDHGKEFAGHQQIAQALHLQFFCAHPYATWERGANENTNGLLRQ